MPEILAVWSYELVEAGLLSPDSLDRARHLANQSGEPVSAALTRLGLVSEEDLAGAFSGALGLPRVASHVLQQQPLAWPDMSPDFLRQTRVLPLSPGESDDASAPIALAMADPTDDDAVEAIALYTRRTVTRAVALPPDL
jgi:general secretion pathway protein E